jgi:corrinoid protein of di/trimethylamine methyltransferase
MSQSEPLFEAILNGDAKAAARLAKAALESGMDPLELVTKLMIPAMDEVGRLFECEEYFVPELLLSGRAMKAALELVRPLLAATGVQPAGRVVIGTVKGDLHDIGKNLVTSLLEGGGFEVHDLGADVSPQRFIAAIQEKKADIVALSALLTVTMPAMRNTIEAFRQAGMRDKVRVMVGGAPVTQSYADDIGADGYSENATAAVALARRLMNSVVAA